MSQSLTAQPGAVPRRSVRARTLLGPACVAAIAYVDPGNFATGVESGTRYGYLLLWVVVTASAMAVLLQYLSAKLGASTGRSLPEVCRERYPRPVVWGLWLQAEVVIVMTDLAELIGGAIALHLLFGLPLLPGALLVTIASFVLLAIRSIRTRRFEAVLMMMLAIVAGVFVLLTLRAGPAPGAVASGLVPRFDGDQSLLLATGIVGATVMPHAVYLHSALAGEGRYRTRGMHRSVVLRALRIDLGLAMGVAAVANTAMLVAAAATLHGSGAKPTLHGAYEQFTVSWAPAAALFAIALLISGLASTSVGVYAGEVVMQGFLRRRVPAILRRSLALTIALALFTVGMDPTQALVLSQVTLSFGIPFALVPLVLLTRRRDVMGPWVNRPLTTALSGMASLVVITLNALLLSLALSTG
ncbi:Nramp family divalent metal transporter [Streptomyces sp. NPDC057474]|uniref:Nramp family divalent metal transporter n=1 Tax=Streptomyces sp. NPDC057474 TaxID=3346144 RepID=UPI0036BE710C